MAPQRTSSQRVLVGPASAAPADVSTCIPAVGDTPACDDGAVPATVDLAVGSRVTFDRVDDVAETSDPPAIRAVNVQVAC